MCRSMTIVPGGKCLNCAGAHRRTTPIGRHGAAAHFQLRRECMNSSCRRPDRCVCVRVRVRCVVKMQVTPWQMGPDARAASFSLDRSHMKWCSSPHNIHEHTSQLCVCVPTPPHIFCSVAAAAAMSAIEIVRSSCIWSHKTGCTPDDGARVRARLFQVSRSRCVCVWVAVKLPELWHPLYGHAMPMCVPHVRTCTSYAYGDQLMGCGGGESACQHDISHRQHRITVDLIARHAVNVCD